MHSNQPLTTIAIPSYNHADYIQETIQSIIEQTHVNIELIIIDDGSKDNSIQKIQEMIPACQARFVRFEFRHRENQGLCSTLNEALNWARGEYFAPTASDDTLHSNKIHTQVSVLENSSNTLIAGVFTGIAIMDENKKIINTNGRSSIFGFNKILLRTELMTGQTVMLRTDIVKKLNGYNENIKIEDLDLFLRLGAAGYLLQSIKEPLVYYRRHNNNLSSQHELMLTAVKKILNQYSGHPLYQKALSKSIMIEAHGIQQTNKWLSVKTILSALHTYPLTIFSKSFLWYLVKLLK